MPGALTSASPFMTTPAARVDSGPRVKDRPERPVVSAMRSMGRHPSIAQPSEHVPYVSLGVVAGHGLLEVTRASRVCFAHLQNYR